MSSTSLKLAIGVLFLSYSAFTLAYETGTELVGAKLEASQAVSVSNSRSSEADSSILYVKNTDFRVVENIGFYIPDLTVKIAANDSSMPVVFDDPTSFSMTPLNGSVVLDGAKLEDLLNKQVFAFKGATLKKLTVKTADKVMTLGGEMIRRGKWVPFSMKGNISLHDGHILKYVPWSVIVDGVDATKVLKAANVNLDELLTVKAPGANLIGSTVVLDTLKLFPPPVLHLNISSASMEKRGLVLNFNNAGGDSDPATITDSNSYILIKGGDVKFMKAMPTDARVQVMSESTDADLIFDLYKYRDQLSAGHLKFKEDGAILAYLKN
ncbi:MAG: hypothetical protein A6F71_01000 [Cycloclasticus sp. symbiont of Poecilosclerida sp. M]|nr:MAG: hypothetical protein A6F71_01000 [Cycloclasticus sp. symbiont of Poecilosclerida sp. M]